MMAPGKNPGEKNRSTTTEIEKPEVSLLKRSVKTENRKILEIKAMRLMY